MFTWLAVLLAITALIYLFIGLRIHHGLGYQPEYSSEIPMISVLIAARNEAANIGNCLESLAQQIYPEDRFEVIIINDRSADDTYTIASEYCQRIKNFKLIDIETEIAGLKGKMNALAQAMKFATGEIILVTDADCRVPQEWITGMSRNFTKDVGLCGAFTQLTRWKGKNNLFDHIQTLDWTFLQAIASGICGLNQPVSVLGNNFGFRKTAYEAVGGFEALGFSLTEDMVLMNAIARRTGYRIIYPLESRTRIDSLPLNTLVDFIQQRRRWLSGGLKAPLWGWVLMVTSFSSHLLMVVTVLVSQWSPLSITGIALVLGLDFSLIWRLQRRLGLTHRKIYFLLFEAFYILYTLILAGMLLIPGEIRWKDRRYAAGTKKKPA